MAEKFDVIVAGGGHAGCEAALAASGMGARTLLVTFSKDTIGHMSCNPSIGGVGKGQLVKEIDALGGCMGRAADACGIQFRVLNSSKGYAARSSRAQIDRKLYNAYMKDRLTGRDNLVIFEGEAVEIIVSGKACAGIRASGGEIFEAPEVVLTTGTFMNGIIHIGMEHFSGGRFGERASHGLSENLSSLGFRVSSFKTGTPARLDGKTIDFSVLDKQDGDEKIIPFSFSTETVTLPQVPCYLTRTNENTHRIIREGLGESPLYSGKIRSTGVRYCPSIEDKVIRFPHRDSHVVFLEPEGLDTDQYYPNGISTSLPLKTQEKMIRSVKGLENVKINIPAYGIEYDYLDPLQLYATLETKLISGLFFAGQINGTTGYEEAAALGLMAGINAARKVKKEPPVILDRSRAYIGVLIDDLVTKGTKEPYRMFTSRVEYRILIREDNADTRLSHIGYELGLVKREELEMARERDARVEEEIKRLNTVKIAPCEKTDELLEKRGLAPLPGRITLARFLKRPDVGYDDVLRLEEFPRDFDYYEKVRIEVGIKYSGYIERELAKIRKFSDLEKIRIPGDFDYSDIPGLSNEVKEKLAARAPVSLGQASRISGVTPAAISVLMVKLEAGRRRKAGL
ncbi:MAG: tRNA uridine-5-carboxymethylaminomethyl(34) synthesis enzyme MnmG [Candidatus Omnitrophota bacterium]